MSTHSIAVIAGDGIGKEVVPAVIECLERIVELHGLNLEFTCFDWGSDYYGRHWRMMPADGLELLAKHDAISLGAVGSPEVSDAESLWGLLIPIRREFQGRDDGLAEVEELAEVRRSFSRTIRMSMGLSAARGEVTPSSVLTGRRLMHCWARAQAKDSQGSCRLQQEQRWQHRITRKIQGPERPSGGDRVHRSGDFAFVPGRGYGSRRRREAFRPGDGDFDQIHSSRELAAMVHDYNYVVLAAPLTTHTTRLVGVEVLTAMKPSARLINVERGQLVDPAALTDALTSGTIAGAALDVVHPEPLPEGRPLWRLENVIITPHMRGATEDYPDDLGQLFVRRVGSAVLPTTAKPPRNRQY